MTSYYYISNSKFTGSSYGLMFYYSQATASRSEVTNCIFTGNKNGFYTYSSNPVLKECVFTGNDYFGMRSIVGSNLILSNCIFHNNRTFDMEKPEIRISRSSYPAISERENDIIFGNGFSIFSPDNLDSTFVLPACKVYWGTTDHTLIQSSFYNEGDNNTMVNFDKPASTPFQYDGSTFNGETLISSTFNTAFEAEVAGNHEIAENNYKLAIEENPYSIDALRSSQRLLNVSGDVRNNDDLIIYYNDLISNYPNTELEKNTQLNLMKIYRDNQDYQTAIEGYEQMAETSVEVIDSLYRELDIVYTYLEASNNTGRAANFAFRCSKRNLNSIKQAKEREQELLELLAEREEDDGIFSPQTETLKISNYPNPFNPTTTIRFGLPEESNVNLAIYNIKGQRVKTLLNDKYQKGFHSVVWNGTDQNNKKVGSGVYFYAIKTDQNKPLIRKCLMLK